MGGRIFKQEKIDRETGEIIIENRFYTVVNNETFVRMRTTNGIGWVFEMPYRGFEVCAYLVSNCINPNGIAIISSTVRMDICLEFKISDQTLSRILSKLREGNYIKRIRRCDYAVNPSYFFDGSSKTLLSKIDSYNSIKDK